MYIRVAVLPNPIQNNVCKEIITHCVLFTVSEISAEIGEKNQTHNHKLDFTSKMG